MPYNSIEYLDRCHRLIFFENGKLFVVKFCKNTAIFFSNNILLPFFIMKKLIDAKYAAG